MRLSSPKQAAKNGVVLLAECKVNLNLSGETIFKWADNLNSNNTLPLFIKVSRIDGIVAESKLEIFLGKQLIKIIDSILSNIGSSNQELTLRIHEDIFSNGDWKVKVISPNICVSNLSFQIFGMKL